MAESVSNDNEQYNDSEQYMYLSYSLPAYDESAPGNRKV